MPPLDSVPCSTLARLLGFDDRPQTVFTLAQTLEQSTAAVKVPAAGSSPVVLGALGSPVPSFTLVDLLSQLRLNSGQGGLSDDTR